MGNRSCFAILLAIALTFTARQAQAQDANCAISAPTGQFVGESAAFTVTISNDDTATGFRPGVDLFLPIGLSFSSAAFEGAAVSASTLVIPGSGNFAHPVTGETLSGTSGDTFVSLEYPVTAQPQSMPGLDMDITLGIAPDVTVGTPLNVPLDCAYLFGSDALNDPATDPPDREQVTQVIVPIFATIVNQVVNAVCTGPSYEFDWTINIDVANGQTLDAFSISDELPGSFQITSVNPAAGTVISLPPGPGGTLEINYPDIVGALGIDATIVVTGFVVDGTVDVAAPTQVPTTNSVSVHGLGVLGSDLSTNGASSTVPAISADSSTNAGAFQVSESITTAPFVPGEVATISLNICVSDNIDIDAVNVNSVLGDGITFDAGSALIDGGAIVPGVVGTGPTTLDFNLGNLTESTETILSYTATINQDYVLTGDPVLAGDSIDTTQSLTGSISSTGAAASVDEANSIADTSVPIAPVVFTKTTLSPLDGDVVAGEVVSFELRASFGSGDIGTVTLTDFVPKPIFDADDCTANPGADHDFGAPTTTVTDGIAGDNFIALTFDPVDTSPTTEVVLHIILDCTVLNGPADDGFVFTNVAQLDAANTAGSQTGFAFTPLTILAPELSIVKTADTADADAGDTVSYEIIVENTGSADAFDTFVSDALPAGLTLSAGPTIVGATFVGAAADFFTAGGVELSTLASGDLVTISYDVTVDGDVSANTNLNNTATIENFESEDAPAAENHAVPSSDFESSETVRVTRFTPSNELADLANTERVVGEDYLYDVVIGIPEGEHDGVVFQYTLDPGLVFVQSEVENLVDVQCGPAGGPFAPCVLPAPVVSADGRTVTWTFPGAISNPADGDTEEITFSVRAAVEDDAANATRGDTLNTRLRVTSANSFSSNVTVIEPTLQGAGIFTGAGDGGDTITLTTSLDHAGASDSDAHDVQLVYNFAGTGLSPIANGALDISSCPGATSAIAAGNTITVLFDTLAQANTCSFPAAVAIDTNVTNGAQLSVPAVVTWESILGDPPFAATADERSYSATFNAVYTVATGQITNTLVSTSRPETSGPGIAVGEEGVFQLVITVPDGMNPSTIVCDTPPPGLAITGFSVDASGFVGTITPPVAPTSGAQGQQVCWDFGNIIATSGAGTVGNSFIINVTTEAEFVSGMAAGSPLNTASFTIGGSDQGNDTADVPFALPTPAITFVADNTSPEVGDTVNLVATLTNTADAPVCDTTVTVAIPAGFTIVDFNSDGLDNDQDGATDEGDEAGLVSGSQIVFPVDAINTTNGCLDDTNSTLSFPFQLTADSGIPVTPVNATATLANYGSLSNGEGDTLSPADDDADNNGVAGIDEAGDGTRTLAFTPLAPNLVFEKTVSDDNGGTLEPSDRITYSITLDNTGTGPAENVTFSDTIPTTNATFVVGSETISAPFTISAAGGVLSANIGTLAAAGNVTITFQMDIETPLPAGSAIVNQATVNADNGYGPIVSDDPSTGAANDATSILTASTEDPDGDGVCTGAVAVPGVCIAGPDEDPNDPNVCADVDQDGCNDCANVFPPDANNDGADGDADGTCDLGDIDIDNDGIPNTAENALGIDPLADADNDGILNFEDPDDQGDGNASTCVNIDGDSTTCDLISVLFDTDQDMVPDFRDLDSDNDGIADVIEAGHGADDTNNDGMVDGPYTLSGIAAAVDADDDQVIDYVIRDTDDDGIPDFQDVDSDNDGLTDIEESGQGGLDGDGDGRIDNPVDADGDGIDENVDSDDTVYGGPSLNVTTLIANFDTDGDGIPDPYDADDGGTGGDSNLDGFDDVLQCPNPPGWPACPDADGDGTPDYSEPLDTDGDGVSDADDLDTDNDGIPDVDETALGFDPYADADNDGVPNYLDADDRGDGASQVCLDANSDLECDVPGADYDSDGDGVANHLDLDSDNDGIVDAVEAGHGQDDGNGFVDCPAGFGVNGLCDDVESAPDSGTRNYPILNTDGAVPGGDDIPDFLDIDSDADGEFDIAEVDALAGLDVDGDGRIDLVIDLDQDGIMDGADDDDATRGFPGTASDPRVDDADADGIPDAYDADDDGPGAGDSDNDGIPDDIECGGTWPCRDIDGDGIPDYMELDDADNDGIPDFIDLDDDNDGITDVDESLLGIDGSADNDNDGIPNAIDTDDRGDGTASTCDDLDSNGACDQVGSDFDFDGDGIPNHFDVDADGDGVYDADESGFDATDDDRDGVLDCPLGFGDNGLCDNVETSPESGQTNEPRDTDNDAAPDFLDIDSDGDSISDAVEAGDDDLSTPPIDTDDDGSPDILDLDTDDDGIPDDVEAGDDDVTTDPVDTDEDGTPDFRDTDSDNDEIDDEDEAGDNPEDPVDTDGDGTPDFQDVDSDNDGSFDITDNCRLMANPDQVDSDLDGLGQACDSDDNGDGYDDEIGVSGGGCSTSGSSGGGWLVLLLLASLFLLRKRRTRHIMLSLGSLLLFAHAANAQPVDVETEYSVERFRLSTDRLGILDVESADVGERLSIDLGLSLGYADDPLNVYRDNGDDRDRIGSLVSHRLGGSLVGSIVVWHRIQIGMTIPLVLSQDQSVSGLMGPPASVSSFGMGDMRLTPKVQILKHEKHWLDAAFSLGFTLPTGSESDYFGDSSAMLQPEILLSKPFTTKLRAGLNIGYRARSAQRALNLMVDDEIYTHLGVGYMITDDLEIDGTFSAATGADDLLGGFNRNFSEVRAGLAYHLKGMVLFAGAGVGTSAGFGTPDWRILSGVRFGKIRMDDSQEPLAVVQPSKPETLDRDGDGILDENDACVHETENFNGFEDTDGCPDVIPDTDNDGINDLEDKCVTEAEDIDTFEDSDGCPDLDNDKDGMPDTTDACPLVAGVDANQGCPAADTDGDGVPDSIDNCPNEAGDPDNAGCKTKQVVKLTGGKLELLDKVYFRTNKAVIRPVSYDLLRNVAKVLISHPEITAVRVEGHTDSQGRDAYNKKLSQRRTEAVVAFLVKEGVDKKRLEAKGFGEEKPIETNDTEDGRAANRRVEFTIVGDSSSTIKQKNSGPTKDTIGQ